MNRAKFTFADGVLNPQKFYAFLPLKVPLGAPNGCFL